MAAANCTFLLFYQAIIRSSARMIIKTADTGVTVRHSKVRIITKSVSKPVRNRFVLAFAVIVALAWRVVLAQSDPDAQDGGIKEEAAALYEQAKSKVREVAQAQSDLASQNRKVKQGAASLYKRAETRVRQQRFEDARKIIDNALSRYPESGVFVSGVLTEPYYPYYLLGLLHLEQGRFDDAINAFLEEERRGQIQYEPDTYEVLKLRLARARQTDNQPPVLRSARAEIIETVIEAGREVADVRFHGVVVDPGGLASLTIDGREVKFVPDVDGFAFDEILHLSPLPGAVPMIVSDVMGNTTRQQIDISIPPLNLGAAANQIHAVLVGIDRYATGDPECSSVKNSCGDQGSFSCYNLPDLNAAAGDAKRFKDFLTNRGVPESNIQLLLSDSEHNDATFENVRTSLNNLKSLRGGTAIFYFAGHGVNSRRHKNLMLMSDTNNWECGDAGPDETTPLEATALGVDAVEVALMQASFDERYIILDACRSPRLASTRSAVEPDTPDGFFSRGVNVIPDEIRANAVGNEPVVFYATFDRSVSIEWNQKKAGYFTWYLLQGLRQNLSLWDLKSYVQERVQEKTFMDHGLTQMPHVSLPDILENDYDLQKRTFLLGSGVDGDIF